MNPLLTRRLLAVPFAGAALLAAFQPLVAQELEPPREVKAPASSSETGAVALLLAKEIVAIGYPEEDRETLFFGTMDETVDQMRTALAPSMPANDPGAMAILDDWIVEYTEASKGVLRKHIPDIMAGMEEAYATIFTVEELRDILTFVRTPSGQRYFELSPAITGSKNFVEANQRYRDETIALLGPARSDLRKRIEQYIADQRAEAAPADT